MQGRIGSVSFTVMTLAAAARLVLERAAGLAADGSSGTGGQPGCAIHFANAYNVALARKDPAYASILERGDFVFSDGVPVTWVGRRAYPPLAADWERVYGPDVMQAVLSASTVAGPSHYLLGGSPSTLASLCETIAARYPDASVVGAESPAFRETTPDELTERDGRIRRSGATVVWVGLGTPKQDTEVMRLAGSLPVVALGVGAAFDFLAGTKPQAPGWMQRGGLEWAFRLASEPRRLGRRYLWGNTVFVAEAVRTLRSARQQPSPIGASGG
ncbi:MAG: WecB/TagA/CpsF family glycosyltransferase [Actinobacteria bacterium]|nr:WecB/TagA/CpsF family glycosyltransferase [Actinomycetota bacterium]